MNLKRTVAPAATPVTLTEAKAHLRVTSSAEDTLITALIAAATDHLDGWTGILGRALVTQTWKFYLDVWPDGDVIRIPLVPLQSVTSVTYLDPGTGVAATVDADDYIVDTVSPDGWIVPVEGFAWPEPKDAINAIEVTFVCGHGDAAAVPAAIKAAILLIVGDLYANREGQSDRAITVNATVDRLLAPWRRVTL